MSCFSLQFGVLTKAYGDRFFSNTSEMAFPTLNDDFVFATLKQRFSVKYWYRIHTLPSDGVQNQEAFLISSSFKSHFQPYFESGAVAFPISHPN